MSEYSLRNELDKNDLIYHRMIVLLVFLAGVLNSDIYLTFMGLNFVYRVIFVAFYGLLALMFMFFLINFIKNKKKRYNVRYILSWGILLIAVVLKFIILFIQLPVEFSPGGRFFREVFVFGSNFALLILVSSLISLRYVHLTVWALGLGASLSAIIPMLFYPEMIGSRALFVDGREFSGAFWNLSVISYISVGWLLVAISTKENNKLKKIILIGIFFLLVLGGLAGLSRATLLSIIVSTVVYLLATNQFVKNLKILGLLSVILLILFIIFKEPIDNFSQRFDGGIDIEDESRIFIWMDYLEDFPDYVLLGEIQSNYLKYSTYAIGRGPHSALLNWLVQFGILGLIGFLVLLKGLLKSINKVRKGISKQVAAGLYAWLAGYLTVALVNETGFKELTVFCAYGIVLAFGKQVDNYKKKASTNELIL